MAKDEHSDLVCSIIARETRLPVIVPTDKTSLRPGCIYLLPASKNGYIRDQKIRLQAPDETCFSSPSADILFTSMAESLQSDAIALIFSGAGSDGVKGVRAIKQAGGISFIQQPEEAQFDSMPQSVIDSGCANHILPLKQLARRLYHFCTEADNKQSRSDPVSHNGSHDSDDGLPHTLSSMQSDRLTALLNLLSRHSSVRFSGYKEDSLLRQLQKRIEQLGLTNLSHYLEYVQQNAQELMQLEQSLLISVSGFFRDPETFALLKPELHRLNQRGSSEPVRILVAGCATGEEACSLAMLWLEQDTPGALEIVAVDLNQQAIYDAQQGIYPEKSIRNLSAEQRSRWLIARNHSWQISPSVKKRIHYQQGNIFDQYWEKSFDLISCRNLMIYLKREQQDILIRKFYDAAVADGLLMTGLAESLSPEGLTLFQPVHHYHRIYRRR